MFKLFSNLFSVPVIAPSVPEDTKKIYVHRWSICGENLVYIGSGTESRVKVKKSRNALYDKLKKHAGTPVIEPLRTVSASNKIDEETHYMKVYHSAGCKILNKQSLPKGVKSVSEKEIDRIIATTITKQRTNTGQFSRQCPKCSKLIYHRTEYLLSEAIKRNTSCGCVLKTPEYRTIQSQKQKDYHAKKKRI